VRGDEPMGRMVQRDLSMKLEQLIIWLIVAAAVCFALRAFFEAYDEVEITYDPTTGRQSVKGRKNRALEGPTPLTLEGE